MQPRRRRPSIIHGRLLNRCYLARIMPLKIREPGFRKLRALVDAYRRCRPFCSSVTNGSGFSRGQRFPNVDTEFNRVWGGQLGNTSMNFSQCPCRGGPFNVDLVPGNGGKKFQRREAFTVSMLVRLGRRRLWRFNKRDNETWISP